MDCVTWATPIFYIDGNGLKLKLRSNKIYLTNHTKSKSLHWLFIALGVDKQTSILTSAQK